MAAVPRYVALPDARPPALETVADVEEITSQWVHWYNTSGLMHRLARRPPADAEAGYRHGLAGHPAQAHT
jgi:hypothetical protein